MRPTPPYPEAAAARPGLRASPRAARSSITRPGRKPQLLGGAAHDDSTPSRQATGPRQVVRPLVGVHVEGAVDLQHQQSSVREPPLAIGEPQASRALPPAHLAHRRRKPEPAADAADVDLGHRLGAALDVAQDGAEQPGTPQRLEPLDPAGQPCCRGEALLHGRGQEPAPRPDGASVGCDEESGGFHGQRPQTVSVLRQVVEVPSRAPETDPAHRLDVRALRHHDGDVAPLPALEPGEPQGRQAGNGGVAARVQHAEPDALVERERSGGRAHDRRRAERPPLRLYLVPHVVVVESESVSAVGAPACRAGVRPGAASDRFASTQGARIGGPAALVVHSPWVVRSRALQREGWDARPD